MCFPENNSPNPIIFAQKKIGKVMEVISKGPDSFCGAWEVFVLPQFRMWYCGHLLSRLAEIRHNMTKQSRFPTVWRKGLKSWAVWNTIQVSLA